MLVAGNHFVLVHVELAMRNKLSHEVRRFATTTRGLLELADWLEASGVTQVAMEATGVYWKPVWHMLEERFQLCSGECCACPQRSWAEK